MKETIVTDWILTDFGQDNTKEIALEMANQLLKGNIEIIPDDPEEKPSSLLNIYYKVDENIKYEIGEIINVKYTCEENEKHKVYVQLLLYPSDVELYQIDVNKLSKEIISLPIIIH